MPEREPSCPVCGGAMMACRSIGDDGNEVDCARCGRYRITDSAAQDVRELRPPKSESRWVMSSLLRRAHELRQPPQMVMAADVPGYLEPDRGEVSFRERLELFLRLVYQRAQRIGGTAFLKWAEDFPAIVCRDEHEAREFFVMVLHMGLVENRQMSSQGQACALTWQGLQRLDEMERTTPRKGRRCFVATWFAPFMDAPYREGFAPAIKAAGFEPVWMKDIPTNQKICDRIVTEIRSSHFVVADMTGQRHNVLFEAGLAMGQRSQVIWSCHSDHIEQVKDFFDTRQYGHVVWTTPVDLYQGLLNHIRANIPGAGGGTS